MAHEHTIGDTGKRFVINGSTRVITIPEEERPVLIQYDHNSEHITFEADRMVEGHDLSLCSKVEIHYNNVGKNGRHTSKGVYEVVDLAVDNDENKVTFTWVVSENATKHEGSIGFVVAFTCLKEEEVVYRWNTKINSDLLVSSGINNGEAIEELYADVLEMWKDMLFGIGDTEEASMLAVGQAQRDAILATGQAQQNAVVAKGEHTLNNIPDDYVALQNQFNSFYDSYDTIKDVSLNYDRFESIEKVELSLTHGVYLNSNGEHAIPTDTQYCIANPVEVIPGEILIVSGYNYAENPTYIFYDLYGNIAGRNINYNASGGTYTREEIVVAPRNAATITINGHVFNMPSLKRVTSFCGPVHKYLENVISSLVNGSVLTLEQIELTEITGKFLQKGVVTTLESGNASFVVTEPVSVVEGEIYQVKCGAYTNCEGYAFYNEHDVLLDGLVNDTGNTYATFEGMILVPRNAVYMRLSRAGNADTISLSKVVAVRDPAEPLKWYGKKWVAVGDSLTESNIRATKNYHDYVAEETGITVVNMGVSGSGYLRASDNNKAFYQRISSVPTDADVITIFGSGNDMGAGVGLGTVADSGTSTLCGAINTTLDNLFATYPLAKVGLITPTPWGAYKPGNDNAMELYSNAIVQICKNRGIPCLDLYHCSGLRPWEASYLPLAYSRDEGNNVHPDENGHAIIAPAFKAFLETLLM